MRVQDLVEEASGSRRGPSFAEDFSTAGIQEGFKEAWQV